MDDLISRQAAIDALRVAYWDDNIQSAKDDPCIVDAMTDWAIRQVKALPSAQPKRGRWERGFDGNHAVCSNCQAWWIPFGEGYKTDYHFCPNCGSDMREVIT